MRDAYMTTILLLQGITTISLKNNVILDSGLLPERVVLPLGITEFADGCFSGQKQLAEIYLPCTLERVGYGCFANCPKLKHIYADYMLAPLHLESALLKYTSATVDYIHFL